MNENKLETIKTYIEDKLNEYFKTIKDKKHIVYHNHMPHMICDVKCPRYKYQG